MTQDDSAAGIDPAPAGEPAPRPAGAEPDPASLLSEARRLRRRARSTRHAYWLPLVLFGLLTLGSAPFYIQHSARNGAFASSARDTAPAASSGSSTRSP